MWASNEFKDAFGDYNTFVDNINSLIREAYGGRERVNEKE
jgi:hypothetical protein